MRDEVIQPQKQHKGDNNIDIFELYSITKAENEALRENLVTLSKQIVKNQPIFVEIDTTISVNSIVDLPDLGIKIRRIADKKWQFSSTAGKDLTIYQVLFDNALGTYLDITGEFAIEKRDSGELENATLVYVGSRPSYSVNIIWR